MKKYFIYNLYLLIICLIACHQKTYPTNGETIYKTGKNIAGEKLLDSKTSRIHLFHSCKGCHGKSGNLMKDASLQYAQLTSPAKYVVPYTESLFFRFLDHDFKSDGTKANIGVIWKMSDQDKKDLWAYLQTL